MTVDPDKRLIPMTIESADEWEKLRLEFAKNEAARKQANPAPLRVGGRCPECGRCPRCGQ